MEEADFLPCMAGVRRGGRGELNLSAKFEESVKRDRWDLGGNPDPNDRASRSPCTSRSFRTSRSNLTFPSLPLVRRPGRLGEKELMIMIVLHLTLMMTSTQVVRMSVTCSH